MFGGGWKRQNCLIEFQVRFCFPRSLQAYIYILLELLSVELFDKTEVSVHKLLYALYISIRFLFTFPRRWLLVIRIIITLCDIKISVQCTHICLLYICVRVHCLAATRRFSTYITANQRHNHRSGGGFSISSELTQL